MTNAPNDYSLSTWKRVMDIQVRLKNGRLREEEMDRLHAELRDTLAQFRSAYAERVMGGPRALRPNKR